MRTRMFTGHSFHFGVNPIMGEGSGRLSPSSCWSEIAEGRDYCQSTLGEKLGVEVQDVPLCAL